MRPDWDTYFLNIAEAVSARADCTRRRIGALIVDADRRIISAGYNGAPPGKPGCLSDRACPRGRHYKRTDIESYPNGGPLCACGEPWPCPSAVAHGSSYDNPGSPGYCHAIHAESNALLFARSSVKGCTIYVTDVPCDGCSKLIEASGIFKSVYAHGDETHTFYHGVRY
jgi:dCMP deaminase